MSTEATPQTTVRALVFTSPAHDLVAVRGTFSPTTSTLLVGQSESVLVDAQYIDCDIAALGDLIESTGTKLTIASVNQVQQLRPATIVAGHKKPEASDQAVEEMIDGTRSYISDFAEAAKSAKDADELVAMMLAKHQTLGNAWTLEFSARAWFARDRP